MTTTTIKTFTTTINTTSFTQFIVTSVGNASNGEITIHRLDCKLGDHLGTPHYQQECSMLSTSHYEDTDERRDAIINAIDEAKALNATTSRL